MHTMITDYVRSTKMTCMLQCECRNKRIAIPVEMTPITQNVHNISLTKTNYNMKVTLIILGKITLSLCVFFSVVFVPSQQIVTSAPVMSIWRKYTTAQWTHHMFSPNQARNLPWQPQACTTQNTRMSDQRNLSRYRREERRIKLK